MPRSGVALAVIAAAVCVAAVTPAPSKTGWTFDFGTGANVSQAVFGMSHAFVATDTHLHAIDMSSGKQAWSVALPVAAACAQFDVVPCGVAMPILSANGDLIIVTTVSGLAAFHAATGKAGWRHIDSSYAVPSPALCVRQGVCAFLNGATGDLIGVNAKSGAKTFSLALGPVSAGAQLLTPATFDGRFNVQTYQNVSIVDATGKVLFTTAMGSDNLGIYAYGSVMGPLACNGGSYMPVRGAGCALWLSNGSWAGSMQVGGADEMPEFFIGSSESPTIGFGFVSAYSNVQWMLPNTSETWSVDVYPNLAAVRSAQSGTPARLYAVNTTVMTVFDIAAGGTLHSSFPLPPAIQNATAMAVRDARGSAVFTLAGAVTFIQAP